MPQLIGLTGASGFIGRRLLEQLAAEGLSVRALVRRPDALQARPGLELVSGDLDCPDALARLVAGCDAVIHLAGAIAGRSYADFARVNAVGTGRLVEILEHHQPGARFILISSLAAREPQLSDYAASKRAGESLVETSHLDWFILRPPAVYGPEDPALAALWRLLARGLLLRVGSARARFSLLHVEDLCRAIGQLLRQTVLGRHICSLDDGHPRGYSWADLATLAGRIRGRSVRVVPVPALALHLAARLNAGTAGLRGRTPLLVPGKVRELTHIDWVCDSTLTRVLHHWSPQRRLEDALPELPGWRR